MNPIMVKHELPGYLSDRLQEALWPGALAESRDAAESTTFFLPPHNLPLFGSSVVVNRAVEQRLGRPVEPAQMLLAALAEREPGT